MVLQTGISGIFGQLGTSFIIGTPKIVVLELRLFSIACNIGGPGWSGGIIHYMYSLMAANRKRAVCNRLWAAISRHRFVTDGGFCDKPRHDKPSKIKCYLEVICSTIAARNP